MKQVRFDKWSKQFSLCQDVLIVAKQRCTSLCVVIILLLCGMYTGALYGQSSNGTITGLVVDTKGGVVANAKVKLVANDGSFKTETVTSGDGLYNAPSIPAGRYTVSVAAPGFEEARIADVRVSAGGVMTVDATLQVGKAEMTVTVTATDPLLSDSSPIVSTTIDQTETVDMAFPERGALGVVMLAPGVTGDPQASDGIGSEIPGPYTGAIAPGTLLSLGGGRPGTGSQLVDGLDITLAALPRPGVLFSADAIKSVSIMTVGLPAQYGRTGGGVINQASTSGTSKYHGALRWRNTNPAFELVAPNTKLAPPDLHLNLFTIAVGGPVPMPFHKGRTFFFATFEPSRYRNETWTRIRVATPDEMAGRFINSKDELNSTILLNQGYAAAVAAPRTGAVIYQFPLNAQGFPYGAQLPLAQYTEAPNDDISAQAAQNPITKFLFADQPTPSNPSSFLQFINPDASYANDGNNAYGVRGVTTIDNRYSYRIDENLTDSDHIFVRFASTPVRGQRFDYHGLVSPVGNVPTETIGSQNIGVNYVRVLSANKVNEVRATFLRFQDTIGPNKPGTTSDFGAKLGLTPAVNGFGVPNFQTSVGQYGSNGALGTTLSENYTFGDDLSWLVGKHAIDIGLDYRALQLNRYDQTNLYGGTYTGGTNTGGAIGGKGTNFAASSLAALDLGLFGTYSVNTPKAYYFRWKYGAAYVQDTWRALPRLTISAGLRYSIETPRIEKFDYQGSFVSNVTGTLNGVSAQGGFAFSGTNGLPSTLWPTNYRGLEPRLGFAFVPKKFMTVRGSYALVHAPLTGMGTNIVPELTASATPYGTNGAGGTNPAYWVNLISNPIASGGPAAAPVHSNTMLEAYGSSAYLPAVDQSNSVPYVQTWNLSLQFQPSRGTVIETDYVGQKGTHLFSTPVPQNDPSLSSLLSAIQAHTQLNAAATLDQWGNKTTPLQRMRPYAQFYSNSIWSAFDRHSASGYNAFYLSGRQQESFGLVLTAAFSWSKSIDDASSGQGGPGDVVVDTLGFTHPQGYSISGDRSLSVDDVPVSLNTGYVWKIPVGRKQQHLANIPMWLDEIVGGWTTSGQTIMRSGYPFEVYAQSGGTGSGYWCSTSTVANATPCGYGTALSDVYLRPNVVPGVPLIKPNWKQDPFNSTGHGGIVNAAAFSMPGSLGSPQLGNAPRTMGNARNPRTINWNASLRKRIDIVPGRARLEIWADAINVLNHPNYFIQANNAALHGVFNNMTVVSGQPTFTLNGTFGTANNSVAVRQFNLGAAITF
ncbi:MAG: carboxypeptidase regulatory-like domain-containing protein [Terracidiphilus sp.]|nr:carboxypeptidase regulatory-like domain-containing protein [Terracidiphilus sp.]